MRREGVAIFVSSKLELPRLELRDLAAMVRVRS